MPDFLSASVEYGGYISAVKLVVLVGLFFLSVPLITWVYHDARSVQTKELLWTGVVLTAAGIGVIVWLLIPLFVIGLMFYLIAVGAASFSYAAHRNSRVMEHDRVLTAEHIRGLFVNKQKKLEALKSLIFVTANNNEVPMPEPRTPDFFGFKTAHELFTDAIWRRASDLMFLPTQGDYKVIYQIDGAAIKRPSMAREQAEFFIRFMKNVADLEAKEKRKPQKGSFKIERGKESIQWELSTAGSTAGEQLRLKLVTQQQITRLDQLGLTAEQQEQINKLREVKDGVFLVSGPKKSGVTTTFYALLRNHDAFVNSIHTLEREPSAELANMTQEVFTLSDTGTTTFARKLRTTIRMGPDIVGVAGCEDSDTAKVICDAAKDAKLLYVTLEADSVLKTLSKWIDLVGKKSRALDSVRGISSQRLVRILCEECKQAYAPNQELLRKFGLPPDKAKVLHRAGKVQYDKHGKATTCENCQGTGFVGRTGIFELIMLDDALREAAKEAQSVPEIGSRFRGAKMLYLQEQALRKVVAGTTSINEMVRVFAKTQNQKQKTVSKPSKAGPNE